MEEQTIRKPLYRTHLIKYPQPSGAGIYALVNKSVVLYVGSSLDLRKRLNHHRHLLSWDKHKNEALQQYYNSFSSDMEFIVIEFTVNLIEREMHYISVLRPFFNLNIPDGNGWYVMSDISRYKMSAAKSNGFIPWNKGIPRTKEEKESIINGIRKNNPNGRIPWNIGIPHSPETKQKISRTKTGVQHNV